ncbi:MAG TPA: DUF4446 family protein [Actinopolymorphaceae bacterium]
MTDTLLAFSGIFVGLLGLLIGGIALVRANRALYGAPGQVTDDASELERLRGELDAILVALSETLRHIAVVRYDAADGSGENSSWSMALLDDAGDGVVITSLNGVAGDETTAKNIRGGESDVPLGAEEREAVAYAMGVAHQDLA